MKALDEYFSTVDVHVRLSTEQVLLRRTQCNGSLWRDRDIISKVFQITFMTA